MDPISSVANAVSTIIGRIWPDKTEEQKAILQVQLQRELAGLDIIKTEASSGNWLTASWRPITMLTFVLLIVNRWLGLFPMPNLPESEILELWAIVKLGIGGYTIGRSVEKVAPQIANALSK